MNRFPLVNVGVALVTCVVGLFKGFNSFDIWMIAGNLGWSIIFFGGYFVGDACTVFTGIRNRDGSVTRRAIVNHLRGISPYPSAEPTELARIAVARIFPDGKSMSPDAVEAVFGKSTIAEARAALGYADGKTWFEEAPGGLLVAELAFRIGNKGEPYERRSRVEEVLKEYQIIACTFARPDLLAAILLEKAGCLKRWAPAADILTAQRKLSPVMLDAILEVVSSDVLNDIIEAADDYIRSWALLFERLETEPKTYEKVLARFAEAGVDPSSIGMLTWKYKTIRNRRRLEAAVKKVGKNAEALKLARAKADILAKANGIIERKAVEVETVVAIEAPVTTEESDEAVVTIETYVSTEASGDARIAVDRIFPDWKTMDENALQAVFGKGTTAEVRASLGYADGKTWFETAPGGLVVAEMVHRWNALADPDGYEYRAVEPRLKLIWEYQALGLTFKRPDLVGATMLQQSGKLDRWAPASNVMMADRAIRDRLLDVILTEVNDDTLNRLMGDPEADDKYGRAAWHLLFKMMQCDPENYEDVLTRFAEAGADPASIQILQYDHGNYKLRKPMHLKKVAARVGARAEEMRKAKAKADLLAKANALTPIEAEAVVLGSVSEDTSDEAGIVPVARKRARL